MKKPQNSTKTYKSIQSLQNLKPTPKGHEARLQKTTRSRLKDNLAKANYSAHNNINNV